MLPQKLILKGLYSYQNEVEIDFEKLTEAGLFGIFGAVGSGKSSILEAIGFALYGRTERLNTNDNRNYNMMNLKSNDLKIEYTFENWDSKIYKFVVKGKRNSRRFEDVGTLKRDAYIWENEEWLPLESADATEILQLNYDNFRRTVIIPQGKFQEFLQLPAKDRTQMLLEIFQLERFDLSNNVSQLNNLNKTQLDEKSGALSQYEGKNQEQLSELQKNSENVLTEITKLSGTRKAKEQEVSALLELAKIFESLQNAEREYETSQAQTEQFQIRRQQLQVYENAKLEFESLLSNHKNVSDKIQQRQNQVKQFELELVDIKNKSKRLVADFLPIQNVYIDLENQRLLLHEYDFAINIQTNLLEIDHQKSRREKGQKFVDDKENEIESSEKVIQQYENQINVLEKDADNLDTLFEIKNWWDTRKLLEKETKDLHERIEFNKKDLTTAESNFSKFGYTISNWQEEIAKKKESLENQLAEKQLILNQITVQVELQSFAKNLEEGKPCPLCGATHHPDILQAENISKHQMIVENENIRLKEEKKKLNSLESQLNGLFNSYKLQENILSTSIKESTQKKEILELHLSKFTWGRFDKNDENTFNTTFEKAKNVNEDLKKARITLNQQNIAFQKLQEEKHKYELAIVEIVQKLESLSLQIEQDKTRLNQLELESFTSKSVQDLNAEKTNLSQKIAKTVQDFNWFSEQIKTNQTAQTKHESLVSSQQSELLQDEKELKNIRVQLEEKLSKSHFQNINEIQSILNTPIDIAQERIVIENFNTQLHTIQTKLQDLKTQVNGRSFDAMALEKAKVEFETLNAQIADLQKKNGNISGQINTLTKELEVKEKLAKEVNTLSIRQENINVMSNLFKGQGFVNYISSVYLLQLCNAANERFYQLTNNHLQLEMNEKNEFMVRDFMNEGKLRSVKTLSGGQTFQAALCLALALADSVQGNKSDQQNFFFLDEGFGSLDKNALSIVFETLKSLRKENRIVGVISHVEDLQQEIPISLLVKNDPETGSYITYN